MPAVHTGCVPLAAAAREDRIADGTAAACRYYFAYEVPRIAAWLSPCGIADVLEVDTAWM